MSRETQFVRRGGTAPSTAGTLPADITDVVFKRIIILCLVTAGLAALSIFMCLSKLVQGEVILQSGYSALERGNDILMILISLGIAGIVRWRVFSPRILIALGLGFGVYTALYHSVSECRTLIVDGFEAGAYFSITQAWIVFFPAIVPIRSRTAFFVILLAAAIPPLSRGLIQSLGYVELPPDSLQIISIVMGFSAIMGLVVSRVVYGLGRSVRAAREMGSYTLEESLGGGGMGEVWRASHRMLARPAAVKLIKPDVLVGMQSGEVERMNHRFEHEVQATAALCSPHTVDIYDYGLAQNGSFYYVMELLDGIDMETLVKRFGPVEPSRVVHYMIQACHSLQEAHKRQLIHRDIKPANLFVCIYGEDFDFVKVLDFGLVKQGAVEDEADMKLTVDGSMAGTPAYIYPEAVSGEGPVDHRADIYSLGCVAYWLLTGQLVFTASTPVAMMMEHAKTDPVPPSNRSEIDIPAGLDDVILACLEKDPANRPQDASELADRLRKIDFEPHWDQERAKAWWELHRA